MRADGGGKGFFSDQRRTQSGENDCPLRGFAGNPKPRYLAYVVLSRRHQGTKPMGRDWNFLLKVS